MSRAMTCIVCPAGCRLTADKVADEWRVDGNKCERGRLYAIEEMTDPKRVVTAVARTLSHDLPYAPVRSTAPIKRDMVFKLLRSVYSVELPAAFESGFTVLRDFEGTGVDVVTTRGTEEV